MFAELLSILDPFPLFADGNFAVPSAYMPAAAAGPIVLLAMMARLQSYQGPYVLEFVPFNYVTGCSILIAPPWPGSLRPTDWPSRPGIPMWPGRPMRKMGR